MLLVLSLGVSGMTAKVKFTKMEDFGENVGAGSWEDVKGAWIPGPQDQSWLRSHNKYKNFILEFDAILQGRSLVLVRSTIEGVPYYFGPGIDLVSATDIRMRRWEDGGWAPAHNHSAEIITPMAWGDPIHFQVTVKGDIVRFVITTEDGDVVIDDEVEAGEFLDAGYIWIRSTSPSAESIIENLTIEELK